MGNYIVKIGEKYLEWSTVVDAPITYLMTREELDQHIREEYGRVGLERLPERVARADSIGTSAMPEQSAAQLVAYNRAGDNESKLTLEDIATKYAMPPP